jgi:hypothetical protein
MQDTKRKHWSERQKMGLTEAVCQQLLLAALFEMSTISPITVYFHFKEQHHYLGVCPLRRRKHNGTSLHVGSIC